MSRRVGEKVDRKEVLGREESEEEVKRIAEEGEEVVVGDVQGK